MGLHCFGLAAVDLFGDTVAPRFAKVVFGAEVVDDQRGAHSRGLGSAMAASRIRAIDNLSRVRGGTLDE